jgi:hypothetical protein
MMPTISSSGGNTGNRGQFEITVLKSLCSVDRYGTTSVARYACICGTECTGAPLSVVRLVVPGMLFQPLVTKGSWVTAS